MSLARVGDSIEFAKELAFACENDGMAYEESLLIDTLRLMNDCLASQRDDQIIIIKATEAYEIPDEEAELEFLPEQAIAESRIESLIAKGRLYNFVWIGSVSVSGFGARLYGVNVLAPVQRSATTLFVPLRGIDFRLKA